MNRFYKSTLAIIVVGMLFTCANAEERTWTNKAGKSMSGSLAGFTSAGVDVVVGGNRIEIPLKDLSKADVDYIEKRRDNWPIELDAKTLKVKSNQTGTKLDQRQIQVHLKGGAGRELNVQLNWIGDGGNSAKYRKFKSVTQKVKVDGATMFKITYNRKGKLSRNYRGCAVRVTNAAGDALGETASQVPFIRFLPAQK